MRDITQRPPHRRRGWPSHHLASDAAPRSEQDEAADAGSAEAYAAYAAGADKEANEVLRSSSPARQRILATRWLIWLAWCAAPYPLSMLTTDTPGAQELSIARSAAIPPKDAPYPTLVGTAMTGRSTSPPITLGSAPSMPATATIALASARRS